jgi:hypothetical protein
MLEMMHSFNMHACRMQNCWQKTFSAAQFEGVAVATDEFYSYCNGSLPSNGQLVTDIVSTVTDANIVSAATAMHCDWIEAFHR